MTEELLEILRMNVNRGGLAMATEAKLLDALRCTPSELRVALQGLIDRKAVRELSPLPYLVAKVNPSWAGSGEGSANPSGNSAAPYSYADSSINKIAIEPKQDSYRAEASDGVIAEILATLGETDPEPFRGLLAHYPRWAIHRALDRVRSAKSIQKSRTALFRYLLPRIAKEIATTR